MQHLDIRWSKRWLAKVWIPISVNIMLLLLKSCLQYLITISNKEAELTFMCKPKMMNQQYAVFIIAQDDLMILCGEFKKATV